VPTNYINIALLFICGGAGALTKDIIQDNALIMPEKKDGKLYLGFLGAIIIGGIVGYLVDHSPITAFSTSFMGMTTIENLLAKKELKIGTEKVSETTENQEIQIKEPIKTEYTKEEIKSLIKRIAIESGVDPDLALKVATCESGLNLNARCKNSPTSIDRGLFQINNYWHPEVTDEQADNPEFATRWFCKAVNEGHLSWWNASKKCWHK